MGLDQYAFTKPATPPAEPLEPAFYWRKHSRLQGFMEALWVQRTGKPADELNCELLDLTAEDIANLRAAVTAASLPHTEGFFYAGQNGAQAADYYREQDLQFCAWAEAEIAAGRTPAYSCWW